MEERKGILTPEQEKLLDEVIVWKNKLGEAVDGPAIQFIDNQGIERLKQKLIEKHPEAEELLYQIVDILMAGIAELITE